MYLKNRHNNGIVLISAVLLLVFAGIVTSGLTIFIVQRLGDLDGRANYYQDIYLAQAGIHYALYNFREHDRTANGYYSLGTVNLDAQRAFIIGGTDADRLMVNTSEAAMDNFGVLTNLKIQNSSDTEPIVIDRMIVNWNNHRKLSMIVINGVTVWNGNDSSPVDADLVPDVTLNTTPTIYPINFLDFQNKMSGATITVDFVMKDASHKSVKIFPASNNNNFFVEATGKITAKNGYRTIRAEYNPLTQKVSKYYEVSTETTF